MNWIDTLSFYEEEKSMLKKLSKFTLYDHNEVSKIDEEEKTFLCLLNCKKINRVYNTICQIDGDFKVGQIGIRCWLLDQEHVIHGQWQYQKIQLTRFAFRYNQRSYRNIFIKTNPVNGEVMVTLSFLSGETIIESQHQFREIMTDLCHSVGEESEMIFNTMLQIIFGREANEPYLKSAIKVNPGFPRYMKVQKLLDKIKSLITTSNFYKIRSDISSAHKNRSYFKKIYLNQEKKLIHNHKVQQMALLYEPKFSKKYEEVEKKSKQKFTHFIKDYIQLEEKNQIEFAKHLNEGIQKEFVIPAIEMEPVSNIKFDENTGLFSLWFRGNEVKCRGRQLETREYEHQLLILKAIGKKHTNMMMHFAPANTPSELKNWIFYLYEEEIPLLEFMRKNSRTMSLSTKLHIMAQICSFIQYLHKQSIGYFIEVQNLFITKGLQIKICGFKRSYRVSEWIQTRKQEQKFTVELFLLEPEELIQFPYRYVKQSEIDNEKCDVMSLGVCLYRVMMDKFPFFEKVSKEIREWTKQSWLKLWTVETEYFLTKGGQLVKIIAHLLLKCMEIQDIASRPYVEWLLVILCEVRTSLNGLY